MRPKHTSQETKMLFLILTDAELPHAFTRFQMCANSDIDYPCWGHLLHRCCFSNTKQTEALKSQDVLAAMFRLHRKASLWGWSFSLVPFHLQSSEGKDREITGWVGATWWRFSFTMKMREALDKWQMTSQETTCNQSFHLWTGLQANTVTEMA